MKTNLDSDIDVYLKDRLERERDDMEREERECEECGHMVEEKDYNHEAEMCQTCKEIKDYEAEKEYEEARYNRQNLAQKWGVV